MTDLKAWARSRAPLSHPRTLKVHGKRNERITDGFGKAKKPHDLALVHEQTAHPHGVTVKDVALLIRADMAAV